MQKDEREALYMKKARWNQVLIVCLCFCLSTGLTGCSGQEGQDNLDSVESEAVAEASDMVAESSQDSGNLDGKAVAQEGDVSSEETVEEAIPFDVTIYDYAAMDNVLAAVVSAMKSEEVNRFYREQPNDAMAANYLYAYVNLFDSDTFQTQELKGKKHDTYVQLDQEYLDRLLMNAFGDSITLKDLKADGDLLLKKGDSFYVALGDVSPVLVDYVGVEKEGFTESTVYSFDYEIGLSDGSTEDGIVQVKFQEASEAESGIVLKAVAIATY